MSPAAANEKGTSTHSVSLEVELLDRVVMMKQNIRGTRYTELSTHIAPGVRDRIAALLVAKAERRLQGVKVAVLDHERLDRQLLCRVPKGTRVSECNGYSKDRGVGSCNVLYAVVCRCVLTVTALVTVDDAGCVGTVSSWSIGVNPVRGTFTYSYDLVDIASGTDEIADGSAGFASVRSEST